MGDHSSRPRIAVRLKQPTRATGPEQAHKPPLFGLAPGGVCRAAIRCRSRGALLPHPFTFAWPKPKAVCSLLHCPWGHPRRVLPATVVPWSPDFPRRAFNKARRGRPTLWRACLKGCLGTRQGGARRPHRPAPPPGLPQGTVFGRSGGGAGRCGNRSFNRPLAVLAITTRARSSGTRHRLRHPSVRGGSGAEMP